MLTFVPGKSVLETGLNALKVGLWPILIYPFDADVKGAGKRPIGEDWGKERHTPATWKAACKKYPRAGIGIKLGVDGGVVDIDNDDPKEAQATLAMLFPNGI